jgi:hypothetical protein
LVDEGGGRISYIVSRECIDEEEMVKLKNLRWQTEKLNEELKNMLGMDEYRVRKKEGIMRYFEILMCVYTFLQYIRIELGLGAGHRIRYLKFQGEYEVSKDTRYYTSTA